MNKTALIVDDSSTMRQMIAFILQNAGFTVMEGCDGQDALTHLSGQRLSLIITDLHMPRMDGIAFTREVRMRAEYKFTPLLVLTTSSEEEQKRAGQAAGATGWIVKPFDPQYLLQIVSRVLPDIPTVPNASPTALQPSY